MAAPRRKSKENQFAKAQTGMVRPNAPIKVLDAPIDESFGNEQEENQEEVESASAKAVASSNNLKVEKPAKPEKQQSRSEKNTDQVDNFFSNVKPKVKGVQRTTYYNREVFDFCDERAKQYGISFSDVVNMLLKRIISEMKGEQR